MDSALSTCHKDYTVRCLLDIHHKALQGLLKEKSYVLSVLHTATTSLLLIIKMITSA